MVPSRYRHRISLNARFAHSQLHMVLSYPDICIVRIILLSIDKIIRLVIKLSTISIGQLHTLLRFHTRPIYLVVFKGSLNISIRDI